MDKGDDVETADKLVGSVIRDTYRVERLLGTGALGRVYVASHLRIPRQFAVKFPRGEWSEDANARARFVNEAVAAARLDHQNVIAVVDYGETDHRLPYLVMELARGESLADLLARETRLPARTALAIARQIADGLAHAHALGVVHRDLKPANIMVDGARVRIVDFGLALILELGAAGRFTTQGRVLGSPFYMAPEQLSGGTADARTDLFGLGMILFEMLAGCRPLAGSGVDVALRMMHVQMPRLRARVPDLAIDPEVEALVARLLARDPNDRPASGHDVVAQLTQLHDHLT
jgi:serine/threonine protein kinase